MKKLFVVLPMLFALNACVVTDPQSPAGTAQQLGVAGLKVAVNVKCLNEINNLPAWKTATRYMTTEQRNDIQTNVCTCVSNKAPNSVTAIELATVAIDPSARTTIANQVVSQTINACVTETLQQAK